nr:gamma-glutamyl-gamma-aminobutyrate hydrolase family protein [Maliibacterium massiliense]
MPVHIGVTCALAAAGPFLPDTYRRALAAAGIAYDVLACDGALDARALAKRLDALLLTGGGDVAPSRFGEADAGSTDVDTRRDRDELALVEAFMQRKKPVFGICRGVQVLNIALGGDIYQDLAAQRGIAHPNAVDHMVRVAPNSFLNSGACDAWHAVTSTHHQGLRRLGAGLVACAWDETRLVEAVARPDARLYGVQWHPERMNDDFGRLFFVQLRRAAGR